MPVRVEYDPSRETIVDKTTGRTVKRYSHQACEHPIRLTDKITIPVGSQTLIPDDHWEEYINHPNPHVRNKVIPEQFRSGTLRVISRSDAGDNPTSLITTLNTNEASNLVEQTFDAAMLNAWEAEDSRPAVLSAIARQREDIKREAGLDAKATSSKTPKATAT